MLDDDIVCLGSRSSPVRPVTGIVLHIDSGAEAPYDMVFRKADTSVVQIGRRSGCEHKRSDEDQKSAMFRCAVVSRKHAKIAFSDSGHAYLIDLGSHHGTHLRRKEDKFPRMLKAETSTMLFDGDSVILGKAVGKGDECVKPISARIELQYASSSTGIFKPLVVPTSVSSPASSSSKAGRYGINIHSSPSSSSSDESYSNYSDIEEIPAPAPKQPIATASSAYNVFKRLFPPRLPSVSEIIADTSSSFFSASAASSPPSRQLEGQPESMPTSPGPEMYNLSVGFDASQHDIYDGFSPSRSHSPMDLASPGSPAAGGVIVARPLSIPPELDLPALLSREEDGLSLSVDSERAPSIAPNASLPELPASESTSAPPISQPESQPQSQSQTPSLSSILQTISQLEGSVAKLHASRRKYKARFNTNVSFVTQKLSEVDDKLAEVDAEYNVLCDQVDGVAHADLPDLVALVEELRERVEEGDCDYDKADEEVDEVNRSADPDVDMDKEKAKPIEEREDVKAYIKTLHDLVDEMRALRDRTQAEMSNELVEIKAIREAAAKDAAQAQAAANLSLVAVAPAPGTVNAAAATAKTPPVLTPSPLKRKRDDTDEVDGEGGAEGDAELSRVSEDDMDESSEGVVGAENLKDDHHQENLNDDAAIDLPPPRKRARRIASVVAQTATAVTIGAVVTWSALAFS